LGIQARASYAKGEVSGAVRFKNAAMLCKVLTDGKVPLMSRARSLSDRKAQSIKSGNIARVVTLIKKFLMAAAAIGIES
jgi:hypothetical protein